MKDETIIEVVNRTTKPLNYTWDGIPGILVPGYKVNEKGVVVPAGRDGQVRTVHLQSSVAEMARRQNIKHGSEDRWQGRVEMLVGIAHRSEENVVTAAPHWLFNDISHTEQGDSIERFDRSTMGEADRNVHAMSATGFPQGRGPTLEPGRAGNDGPIGVMPGAGN
jgi:hypothetical protein